jgi:hypothetical protein
MAAYGELPDSGKWNGYCSAQIVAPIYADVDKAIKAFVNTKKPKEVRNRFRRQYWIKL